MATMLAAMIEHRHPAELAVEWGSASLLAVAAGFFVRVALTGIDPGVAIATTLGVALAAGAGAFASLRAVGHGNWRSADFELSPIDGLVTGAAPIDDELLLTDAIDAPAEESRAVRLFAPETLQIPGELAERIDEWLDGARSRLSDRVDEPCRGHGPAASPASAALHTALADIRRSLG